MNVSMLVEFKLFISLPEFLTIHRIVKASDHVRECLNPIYSPSQFVE
jgi:hypothetical protein